MAVPLAVAVRSAAAHRMAAAASAVRVASVVVHRLAEAVLPVPVGNDCGARGSRAIPSSLTHASRARHIFNKLIRPEFADDELSGHGQSERPIRRLSRDFQYDLRQFLRWLRSKFFRLE